MQTTTRGLAAASIALAIAACQAAAQSDPSTFGQVFHLGAPPPGSPLDFTGAIQSDEYFSDSGPLELGNGSIGGDEVGPNTQLNVFANAAFPDDDFSVEVGPGPNSELNLFGVVLPEFSQAVSVGGTINSFGANLESLRASQGGVVNVFAGSQIELVSTSVGGGTINIIGGTVGGGGSGRAVILNPGGTLNISGGTFDGSILGTGFGSPSNLSISGGVFSDTVAIAREDVAVISGGQFNSDLRLNGDAELEIIGTAFFLDGTAISGLEIGDTLEIAERGATLSGTLADGSQFSFDLNAAFTTTGDFFSDSATLNITLVPTPPIVGAVWIGAMIASRRRR